jgi:hypothetical protein
MPQAKRQQTILPCCMLRSGLSNKSARQAPVCPRRWWLAAVRFSCPFSSPVCGSLSGHPLQGGAAPTVFERTTELRQGSFARGCVMPSARCLRFARKDRRLARAATLSQAPLGMGDNRVQRGAAHAVALHDGVNKRIRKHLAKRGLDAKPLPRQAFMQRAGQFGAGALSSHGSHFLNISGFVRTRSAGAVIHGRREQGRR